MKRSQPALRNLGTLLLIAFSLFLWNKPLALAQAQAPIELQLVDPTNVPPIGNFYSTQAPDAPPTPIFIFAGTGIKVDVYQLGAGFPPFSYLVDDAPLGPLDYSNLYNPVDPVTAARNFLAQQMQPLQNSAQVMAADDPIPDPGGPPPPDPAPILLDPSAVPAIGTFYFLVRSNYPPMPYNPCAACSNCSVWLLGDGSLLVDDANCTWPEPTGDIHIEGGGPYTYPTNSLWLEIINVTNGVAKVVLHGTIQGTLYTITSQQALDPSQPWSAEQTVTGGPGSSTQAQVLIFGRTRLFLSAHIGPDIPQRLWLQALGVTNGSLSCLLIGTLEGSTYQIWSRTALDTNHPWASETTVQGASNQFWTPFLLPTSYRPALFLTAQNISQDSDGQGLPDWWQLKYFQHLGVDPYADPDGDAWSNIQEYQNGTDPNHFDPPPAPVAWAYIPASGNSRVIQWESAQGLVQGYELVKYHVTAAGTWSLVSTQIVGNAVYSLTDTNIQQPQDDPDVNPNGYRDAYLLYGLYNQGASLPATVTDQTIAVNARLVHGHGDAMQLALFSTPKATTTIRVSLTTNNVSCGWGVGANQTIDIPMSAFSNRLYTFTSAQYPYYAGFQVTVQAVTPNGFAGLPHLVETDCMKTIRYPFLDATTILKDNLIFTLQSQFAEDPDPLAYGSPVELGIPQAVGFGCRQAFQIDGDPFPVPVYAATSYRDRSDCYQGLWTDAALPLRPWEINKRLRVVEYASITDTCWFTTNSTSGWNGCGLVFLEGDSFAIGPFTAAQSTVTCPDALSDPAGRFVGAYKYYTLGSQDYQDPIEPLINNWDGTSTVFSTHPNAYGLALRSLMCTILLPTGAIDRAYPPGATIPYDWGILLPYWERFEVPSLQPDTYLFTTGGNLESVSPASAATNSGVVVSNLLITSVGDPDFTASAWLRYRLTNGATDIQVYGYIDQYWDKAYKLGTNGAASSIETGILSPYGYFFPTEPGAVALRTVPNLEYGTRGTGIVHVISLSTDANHDGTIDPSFYSPDFTTHSRPFRFWVNDNHDAGDYGGDGIPAAPDPDSADNPNPNNPYKVGLVNGARDLVDFFPVCLNIRSLVQSSPPNQGTRFVLSHADEALNFAYTVLTLTNYMDWLHDTNTAHILESADTYRIPASGVELSANFLYSIASNNTGVLLVEARQPTTKPLVLSILQGTNLVTQTSLYLSIGSVEQMFRHKNLITETFPNGNNLGAYPDRLRDQDISNEPDTNQKNFVFVHGYSVNPNQARGAFADVFKRMYWSGSHAKFYGVTWRGSESQGSLHIPFTQDLTPDYHINVANAFLSAPHLASFLATLTNGPSVLAAHSLGNMVAISALSDSGANPDKFFMIDAAVAMEAIDGDNTPVSTNMIYPEGSISDRFFPAWHPYARRLYASDWFRLFPSGDARSLLSWSNRLANLPLTNTYNFYSSGEEVLREYTDGAPPSDLLSAIPEQLIAWWNGSRGVYAWAWQEKAKGRASYDTILGSTHGGWRFSYSTNYSTNYFYQDGWVTNMLSPAQVANLPPEQLRTNAFFQMTSPTFVADAALYGPSGSDYAATNRNRILGDTIPTLTLPIGANPVTRLSPPFNSVERNFDLNDDSPASTLKNGWPPSRSVGNEAYKWHHSDFRAVAYTYTYKFFNKIVNDANLK